MKNMEMDRRSFVKTGVAATVAVGLEGKALAAATPKKMNVLYLFSDQHRECSMPGKPHSTVEAPNLDKFAKANFVMENCISNYPLCTPHRAILISGRYPQQSGMGGNGVKLKPYDDSLGHVFANAGYSTGYVGKWHLDGNEMHFIPPGGDRQGFQDWRMWAATNDHYEAWTYEPLTGARIQPSGWNATLMTDDALTFLKKQKAEKPFFLVVSWNPPHPPFDPPPVDADVYKPADLAPRPNVQLNGPGLKGHFPQLASEQALRKAERGYYGGITGIDKEFARILAALEANGQMDNTMIIYTSDHGEMMGSHNRMNKIVPWEESCHVPFFVRMPGVTKAGSSKELFASVDIFPTLCGMAGIPIPKQCLGRDMSAVFTGGKAKKVDGVFLMADGGGASLAENDIPTYRGIRTDTHSYAVMGDGRWLLYDNVADPLQMKNMAADPGQKELMDSLDLKIQGWLNSLGDRFDLKKASGKVSSYPS